jgi:RNA polymerase sigma factor (TIGR02999 family)
MRQQDGRRVSQLLAALRQGDQTAVEQLITLLYPDLHRLARTKMRAENRAHTWQPTVLVNELYLKLKKLRGFHSDSTKDDLDSFLALAARMMNRILISHARPQWKKARREGLETDDGICEGHAAVSEIEAVLDKLGSVDPRLREVVELRVFEELTIEGTAERMGCSPRTVVRHWNFARHWLEQELKSK